MSWSDFAGFIKAETWIHRIVEPVIPKWDLAWRLRPYQTHPYDRQHDMFHLFLHFRTVPSSSLEMPSTRTKLDLIPHLFLWSSVMPSHDSPVILLTWLKYCSIGFERGKNMQRCKVSYALILLLLFYLWWFANDNDKVILKYAFYILSNKLC